MFQTKFIFFATSSHLISSHFTLSCEHHFLFSASVRAFFKMKLKRMRQSSARSMHGSLRISVRRQNVFDDSFQSFRYKSADEMRRRLSVTFHGEEGMDAGGLTREWYSVLAREIFNANYALFTATSDSVTFQPNSQSYINPEHLSYFKFVGRVIGKAICDGQLLDAHFTRSFYKVRFPCTWIGRSSSLLDLLHLLPHTLINPVLFSPSFIFLSRPITSRHLNTSSHLIIPLHDTPSVPSCPFLSITYSYIASHRFISLLSAQHMLGQPVSYHDLEGIEPEYYKSLKQILTMPLDLLGLDDSMTFSAESNDFGHVETKDLVVNGRNIYVTDDNKLEYVRLVAHHRMTTAIRKQIDSFLEGFHELVPPELISLFDAQELELLISGLPDIDLDDLRAHTGKHHPAPYRSFLISLFALVLALVLSVVPEPDRLVAFNILCLHLEITSEVSCLGLHYYWIVG